MRLLLLPLFLSIAAPAAAQDRPVWFEWDPSFDAVPPALSLLADAECPDVWPADAVFPEDVQNAAGEEVHIRVIEACLDVQLVRSEHTLSDALDGVHDAMSAAVTDRIAAVGAGGIENYDPRPTLADAHAQWMTSRDADCAVLAQSYFGGTGAAYEGVVCHLRATRERLDWTARAATLYDSSTD
jgi:uncharacterized protein YecT (DUF1311 family)